MVISVACQLGEFVIHLSNRRVESLGRGGLFMGEPGVTEMRSVPINLCQAPWPKDHTTLAAHSTGLTP